ncbi:hypothetical protein K7432_010064 [Basidiobolus ranarum]|uniref:Rab-GAP TBC domain-containing protein n=1 Tax=Basidiobolus ranarum TaxID=34480 RepID=A0ABR2VW31_9FUNG
MKTYNSLGIRWRGTLESSTVSLQTFKDRGIFGTSCKEGLRSLCWKVYLDCLPSLDTSSWSLALQQQRQYYEDLKKRFVFDPNAEETAQKAQNLAINNPLSLDQESPWIQYFKDGELRKIIKQDVERTFPDSEYFRASTVQTRLINMLFIYCKLHEDVSYRQGMHELLAPILQVVDDECLDFSSIPTEKEDDIPLELMKVVLNPDYVEHDAFSLFSNLMKSAKEWYEFNDELSNQRTLQALKSMGKNLDSSNLLGNQSPASMPPNQTPIVVKCNRIHHELLKTYDPQLYAYLESLEIEPQLYGIRWLRLLFGREFPLKELLCLWDGIFADNSDLNLVDYVCIAMLLYIREDLLAADYAMCLHRIMKFPSVPDPTQFVKQALQLRDHLGFEGGSNIILQNAKSAGRQAPTLYNNYIEEVNRPSSIRPRRALSDASGTLPVSKHQIAKARPSRKRDEAIAQLNKAMLDIKKTVNPLQTYLKRTLSYNQPSPHDTISSQPDFQSIYEHAIPQNPPVSPTTIHEPSFSNNKSVPASKSLDSPAFLEIGSLMDKCVSLLENGIYAKSLIQSGTQPDQFLSGQITTPSKSPDIIKNEMDIVTALIGLKHIRDVLNKTTVDLNPNILDQQWYQDGDDHWELVEHHSDSDEQSLNATSTLGITVQRETSPKLEESDIEEQIEASPAPPSTAESQFYEVLGATSPQLEISSWQSESNIENDGESVKQDTATSESAVETQAESKVTLLPSKHVSPKADVLSSLESILAEDGQSPFASNRSSNNPNYNWIFNGGEEPTNVWDGRASITFTPSGSTDNLREVTPMRMSQSLDLGTERRPPIRTKKLIGKSVGNDSDDPLKSKDVDRRNIHILDDYA